MSAATELGRSTAARIGFGFAFVLGTAILVFGGVVHYTTVGYMDRQADALIEAEIEGLAEVYTRDGLAGLVNTLETRIARDPGRSTIYLVADAARTPLIGNISAWPAAVPNESGWMQFDLTEPATHSNMLARARPFLLRGGVNLLVGRDIRALQETKRVVQRALIWGMAVAMVLGLSVGWIASVRLTRRLRAIIRTSRAVMRGDIARRIPRFGSNDDLDEVAQSLNAMLDEIERLMSGIENVTNNIAHDLRTPLSHLRNRLASLYDEIESDGTRREATSACIAEVDQLLATFAALLRIAKLEAAGSVREFPVVDLADVVRDAVELYEPVARERAVRLVAETATIRAHGERNLLLQALCNLLDNAIKYSPEGGCVRVRLAGTHAGARLSVRDEGSGIRQSERERVFERFYRGDGARGTDGSGLGLSLVRAICHHHGATITIDAGNPGTIVRIDLRPAPDGTTNPPRDGADVSGTVESGCAYNTTRS